MKKTLLFMSFLMLMLASCKKDTESVTRLLETVPSSAAGVVVIDLEALISDTGSEIKEDKIAAGKELQECISKLSPVDQADIKVFLNGDTGIEPKAAVLFYDSSRTYLTFLLKDETKFTEFVEKTAEQKFQNATSSVKVCGSVAMKGSQAWVLISSGRRIDPDGIDNYASLRTSQSFLVTPMGEKLLTEENDVRGWALFGSFFDEMLNKTNRTMFAMGAGFVFENAESLAFKADFKKGEFKAEITILNDKYQPAKYQLPTAKVDVSTLKQLGETCGGMMAFTINKELIEKFDKVMSAFGGALFGNISETFNNVDGTVGIIASATDSNMEGIITTKGEVAPSLKEFISENLGAVSVDGNYVRFTKGAVSGSLSVSECAEALSGCCLGIVADAAEIKNLNYGDDFPQGYKSYVVKLVPASGGLVINIDAKSQNPDENALLTFIKLKR